MKRITFLLLVVVLLPLSAFAQLIDGFESVPADTNYWKWNDFVNEGQASGIGGHYTINANADPELSYILVDYVNDPVFDGEGALQMEWQLHYSEDWGGFAKIEHWHPDSSKVYDFSVYDSISVMYYNETAASEVSRVEFRLNLHDVSDSPNGANTYTNTQVEYYYSFHKILDMDPGWNEIKMPLVADPNFWDGQGFNLTKWAGIEGNGVLDLDQIKGFTFEFSVNTDGVRDDLTFGTLILDKFMLKGPKAVPFIFFNGKNVPSNISLGPWGGSTLEVEEGAGATEGTNALKWVQGNEWNNGWSGVSLTADPPFNMLGSWESDSIKFKMKADAEVGPVRVQLEDGVAKVGKVFSPNTDGAYHDYAFKLSELEYQDGTADFNPANVVNLVFMGEGNADWGRTIYIDDLWTGNPVLDIVAPPPPATVSGVANEYYNEVTWEDVPEESGEVYDVYASPQPITTLDDPQVEMIASSVAEDTQSANHYIYAPLEDTDVDYYYAVTTRDEAGNVSETFTATSSSTTNAAKGIATISLNPPVDFVADGDLSEWTASNIMPFVLTPETDFISYGAVNDANDLTGTVYVAMDADNFYIAVDVIDDVFNFGDGNWWEQDAFEMFIGLYDRQGPKHTSIKRGAEPDYKIVMTPVRLNEDFNAGEIFLPDDENYHFEDFGGADYVAEAKIPFDSLAKNSDGRFTPVKGMRIPIEITFHDNDGAWDGNLTTSRTNADNAWQTPAVWFETWITETPDETGVESFDNQGLVHSYSLLQNYPNPFNPSTIINFSLEKSEQVELTVYNQLGQKVAELVNSIKPAGQHNVIFEAKELPSGIYFYRLKSGSFEQTKKMILMQ